MARARCRMTKARPANIGVAYSIFIAPEAVVVGVMAGWVVVAVPVATGVVKKTDPVPAVVLSWPERLRVEGVIGLLSELESVAATEVGVWTMHSQAVTLVVVQTE
jgi:hypothetical protein